MVKAEASAAEVVTGPEQWETDTWKPNSHLGLDLGLPGIQTFVTEMPKNNHIFWPSTTDMVSSKESEEPHNQHLQLSNHVMCWELKHV